MVTTKKKAAELTDDRFGKREFTRGGGSKGRGIQQRYAPAHSFGAGDRASARGDDS